MNEFLFELKMRAILSIETAVTLLCYYVPSLVFVQYEIEIHP